MSILVPILLAVLALAARPGHGAALVPTDNFLTESIKRLSELLETKVSCDKMNVTNIFAGNKEDDDMEVLCKATTIAWEGRSCHMHLEGIYVNLLALLRRQSPEHQAPCPVAAGNTTSLNAFFMDLRKVLQRLVKDRSLK